MVPNWFHKMLFGADCYCGKFHLLLNQKAASSSLAERTIKINNLQNLQKSLKLRFRDGVPLGYQIDKFQADEMAKAE
jgi:hypothetical protein